MGAKLLIIDDEPDLCSMFRRIFEEEGHQVLTATTGRQGIERCRREKPNIIFLDLKMPGMDGIACLKRLYRVSKNSKVVVLTGYGSLKTAKEAMQLGAYDYTAKPFDLDLVRSLIREILGG